MQVLIGKKKFLFLIFLFFFFTTYQNNKKNDLYIFKIEKVNFIGDINFEENIKDDIIRFLIQKNLYNISINELSKFFDKSRWLKNFSVKRKYPNQIDLFIIEYKPIAVLKKKDRFFLVNEDFKLSDKNIKTNNTLDLIIVTGKYENKYFKNIYKKIVDNKIFSRIKELHLLNLGRLDLYLKNNIHIKMGYYDIEKQIKILEIMLSQNQNLTYIDLRNENTVIVK
ncbi:MAG: FtsQ-type POTRA domain-containing protein [alpha proteobacterium HIMB114]|nr:MAG: FtsQ-type POTRA domain-containing protein [alpha proteobacterium HIMB114]|tara:strand:- start:27965 stop:28636 length:672 start_codon:yes stop_codon:yes gene_type:complete